MGLGSYIATSSNMTHLLIHKSNALYIQTKKRVKQFDNRFIISICCDCSFQMECDQCKKNYCVGCQRNNIVLNIDTEVTTCINCAAAYVTQMQAILPL